MKPLLIAAAMLAAGPALATNVRALSEAEARSLSEARSEADARATALQTQRQSQAQRQTAKTGDVTSAVTVQGDDRAAAGAYAATVFPTAPCVIPASGGVQGITFGLSLAGGITDLVCQGVTLATGAHQIGRQDIADVAMEAALAEYLNAVTPQRVQAQQEFPK